MRVWVLEMLMCEELVPLAGDNQKKKKKKKKRKKKYGGIKNKEKKAKI